MYIKCKAVKRFKISIRNLNSIEIFFLCITIKSHGFHGANHASNTVVTECLNTLFFYIRMLFFQPRLNILIFLPILG